MVVRILFVCHGNICRSPMAEFVMKDIVRKAGAEDDFVIASCATSNEEIGNGVHYGTRNILSQNGVPFEQRSARRLKSDEYDKWDYIIGMDEENIRGIMGIIGKDPENKVSLLMSHAGEDRAVEDPWYTGGFGKVYLDITKGCNALFGEIRK
ncbi:Protein-tyrosine-phosphatase [Thermoplasmatales archaeon BRNA1]|nr:Protein-tyrosine-phosphatase [Thermoplasmatales archaeon BRNA1]